MPRRRVSDLAAPQGFEPRYADPEANHYGNCACSSESLEVYGKLRKLLSFLLVSVTSWAAEWHHGIRRNSLECW